MAIYHGNRPPTQPAEVGTYYGGSLLLDASDPTRVLKRTAEPSWYPKRTSSGIGFVPNVVFPDQDRTGGEKLLIYYGAADAGTAVAAFELREVVERDDDRELSPHAFVMALSTSSSGTVANVLA